MALPNSEEFDTGPAPTSSQSAPVRAALTESKPTPISFTNQTTPPTSRPSSPGDPIAIVSAATRASAEPNRPFTCRGGREALENKVLSGVSFSTLSTSPEGFCIKNATTPGLSPGFVCMFGAPTTNARSSRKATAVPNSGGCKDAQVDSWGGSSTRNDVKLCTIPELRIGTEHAHGEEVDPCATVKLVRSTCTRPCVAALPGAPIASVTPPVTGSTKDARLVPKSSPMDMLVA